MPGPFVPSSRDDSRRRIETLNRADIQAFVADRFNSAEATRTLVISVPAPVIRPTQLLQALPEHDVFCWQPPTGSSLTSIGIAREITVSGPHRCEHLALAGRELFSELKVCSYPGLAAPAPRMFGGLAFAAGLDNGPLWKGFDDGRFVLPRWCYGVRGEQAYLSLAVVGGLTPPRQQALRELRNLWEAFENAPDGEPPDGSIPNSNAADDGPTLKHLDPLIWNQRIKRIRKLITGGEYQKIVTARTTTIESQLPFNQRGMMDRLTVLYPNCTRFLFRRSGTTFIGATPETLFAKRGAEIRTHALAGSVKIHPDLSAEEAGEALLKSRKNQEEHTVVVRQVLAALQPLVDKLDYAETPRVMRLQNLLHLETPVRARLRLGSHIAELLAALHPTPAVAGLPRDEAMQWIAANEEPRGWYSGPIGWFDTAGDGEFAVAIRCALLQGQRAHAFAGAGIMHDSDPPMEYGETAIKLQAMLRALGVET